MSSEEIVRLILSVAGPAGAIVVFVLALFIGFCVVLGFTKLKRTAGRAMVIKSLDEQVSRRPVSYLGPSTPRGPADQLKAPELLEAAARK